VFLIVNRDNMAKIKTEHVIFPKEWDFKKQQKRELLAGSVEFNNSLSSLKNDILANYQKIIKDFPDMPFSKISELLKEFGKTKEIPFLNNDKDFFQVMDEFILSLEEGWTIGTIKKFKTLKKNLQEFGIVNKKYATITFSTLDHSFEDAYKKYLRNQEPRGRQKTRPEGSQFGLLNASIGKYIECLKTFCKWAAKHNYNTNDTYKDFETFTKATKKTKKQDHDIVTLTLQELKLFYSFDFSKQPVYGRIRDLFCFGCYTGQRWSDIERLEKQEIHGDIWSFTAFKTKKETEIDLIGFAAPALDILKKYDYQLPKYSLQKFNQYLKDAAKAAGIDTTVKIRRYIGVKEIEITKPKHDFLGSHTARKTCVSILLNNYNMNITHVLQITGHSDLKTLQKYIDVDRKSRREAIGKTPSITDSPLTVVKHKAG
jgi:integrase